MLALLLVSACSVQAAIVCRIVSGTTLAFGAYDVLSLQPKDTQGTVGITCDRSGGPQNVTVLMRLGIGTHGTSVSARRMRDSSGSGDFLSYGLYRDSGRNNVWGSSDNIDTMSQALSVPNNQSRSVSFVIYGRIPAQQDVSAGSYGDSVQITVTP